jgi:hypothetical protein
MKALAFIPLSLALMAPASPQIAPSEPPVRFSGHYRGDMAEIIPPERFRGDVMVIAVFSDAAVIELCPPGAIACVRWTRDDTPVVVMPNPNRFAGAELYATILSHELGHASGWSGEHGDEQ